MSHVIYWDKVGLVHVMAQNETKKVGEKILSTAKDQAPVDTGHLRNSGFIEGGRGQWVIGFSAHYAHFQEFGTSKMHAHPFLRPAIGMAALL